MRDNKMIKTICFYLEKICDWCRSRRIADDNNSEVEIKNLRTLDGEDLRKVHAEVNQYINQRFLISTTAITITGVILGWIITGAEKSYNHPNLSFISTAFLISILFYLHKASTLINESISNIASYLRITKTSVWEITYNILVHEHDGQHILPQGQEKFIHNIFMFLGTLSFITPFIIGLTLSPLDKGVGYFYKYPTDFFCLNRLAGEYIVIILFIIYMIIVHRTYTHSNSCRKSAENRWLELETKWKDAMEAKLPVRTRETPATPPVSDQQADHSQDRNKPPAPPA